MASKTPQFDTALEAYFKGLELDEKGGQERTCRFSGEKFYVRSEDIAFYKHIGVPLPTIEPEERRRRRMAYNNSYNLYKGVSAHSGKKIIMVHPPGHPYKVYEHLVWYSDKWDPFKYGIDFNPEESFFKQFSDLQIAVPRPNLITDTTNINSEYTNVSTNLKNCYITFDQFKGEDLYYHQCCSDDRNCIECWAIDSCDTCYECKLSQHLFKGFYCEHSRDCLESYFLWDCRNCDHCFMSSNLRNKKYFFRNEYVGKEEYEKRMKEINFGNFDAIEELRKEFEMVKVQAPRKPFWNEKNENALGDYVINSKNVYRGLYVANSENISYSEGPESSRDIYDLTGGSNMELCYEVANIWLGDDYLCKFGSHLQDCREVEYSEFCRSCKNCFGCEGLNNKQFCIFNKQYSEDEYWKKVDEIKTKMLENQEYGEFFPPKYSPFPYRTAWVTSFNNFRDYDVAEKYGYDVSIPKEEIEVPEGEATNISEIPKDIKDIDDSICEKIIFDEKNNKYFRYIKPEIVFYKEHTIPVPREHPSVRMQRWRDTFNLRLTFFRRTCPQCNNEFETTYLPDSSEIVYCEPCYQKALN